MIFYPRSIWPCCVFRKMFAQWHKAAWRLWCSPDAILPVFSFVVFANFFRFAIYVNWMSVCRVFLRMSKGIYGQLQYIRDEANEGRIFHAFDIYFMHELCMFCACIEHTLCIRHAKIVPTLCKYYACIEHALNTHCVCIVYALWISGRSFCQRHSSITAIVCRCVYECSCIP